MSRSATSTARQKMIDGQKRNIKRLYESDDIQADIISGKRKLTDYARMTFMDAYTQDEIDRFDRFRESLDERRKQYRKVKNNLQNTDPIHVEEPIKAKSQFYVNTKAMGKMQNITRLDKMYEVECPIGILSLFIQPIIDFILEAITEEKRDDNAKFVNIGFNLVKREEFNEYDNSHSEEERRDKYMGFHPISETINNPELIYNTLTELIEQYDADEFILETITLEFVYPRAGYRINFVGNTTNKQELFIKFDGGYLFNPNSQFNCLLICALIGANKDLIKDIFQYDVSFKNRVQKRINHLKNLLCISKRSMVNINIIPKLADHLKATISLIDFFDKEKTQIFGNGEKSIVLYQKADHIMLYFKANEEAPETEVKCKQFYIKRAKDIQFNKNFYVGDLETTRHPETGRQIAYKAGFAYYPINNETMTIDDLEPKCYDKFEGDACIAEMFDSLFKIINNQDFPVLYFHNGGRFDLDIIIDQFLASNEEYTINDVLYSNGRILKAKIINDRDQSIDILDSCAFLNNSLKELTHPKRGFKVKHTKQVMNHAKITYENCLEVCKTDEMERYYRNDLLGMLEVVDKFSKVIWNKFEVDITRQCSSASVGRQILLTNYLNSNSTIGIPSKDEDLFIRRSYHGGRTELFYRGLYQGKLFYRDFTSLFPHCATFNMPLGKPQPFNRKWRLNTPIGRSVCLNWLNEHCCILKVQIKSIRKDVKPLMAIYMDVDTGLLNKKGEKIIQKRQVYAHTDKFVEITITGVELSYIVQYNLYEIKIIEGYQFNSRPYLSEIHRDLFKLKNDSKKSGAIGESLSYKILLNCIYGGTGMSLYNSSRTELMESNEMGDNYLLSRMTDSTLKHFKEVGKYYLMNVKSDVQATSAVQIASYITARARCLLWEAMYDIEQVGEKVLYADTDSVITTCDFKKYPNLLKKYDPTGKGDILGSMKDELDGDYMEWFIGIAPKLYAYEAHGKFEFKSKGIPKRSTMCDKCDLEEEKRCHDCSERLKVRFLNLLNEPEEFVTTSFFKHRMSKEQYGIVIDDNVVKKVSGTYLKGQVGEDGWITPYVFD